MRLWLTCMFWYLSPLEAKLYLLDSPYSLFGHSTCLYSANSMDKTSFIHKTIKATHIEVHPITKYFDTFNYEYLPSTQN